MDKHLCGIGLAWLALVAASPQPPVAPREATTDVIQGVRVADPYRWLETPTDPRTRSWLAAQNAASRAYLDGLAVRRPLHDWLLKVEQATPAYDGGLKIAGGTMFAFTVVPEKQQPMLNRIVLEGDTVRRLPIVDPNALSAKGDVAIDWFEPSPDGRLVAASLSQGGSEDGTLHVYDAASGREVEAPIPHVQYPTAGGSLAWAPDGRSFWYTRFPKEGDETERHFNQTAWFHRVGRPAAEDVQVLSAKDGLPRTAEIFLANPLGQARAFASVQFGDGGEFRHYMLTPGGATRIADYGDKVVAATQAPDGGLFGISRKDAPNGKIVRYDPKTGAWRTIVPEGPVALVSAEMTQALAVSGDRLYATAIDGGPTRLLAFSFDGKPQVVETPPVSAIGQIEPDGRGGIYYRQRSYTVPSVTLHLAAGAARAVATPLRLSSPLDFSDVAVEREFATSRDGTKVPVTVIHKRSRQADGRGAALLYGYGGYGINLSPRFLGAFERAWLDAGGVYAIANIRGGSEYGERWHQQGMLTAKQNVFDDFAAAARLLKASGWAAPDRLALMGGSNGGLLMGATVTQQPDLARAVVSQVGIYDMLRVELDPNGAFNVAEFGTVQDPAQFRALHAYSPYHHVTRGGRYPAMLLTTGDNDGRVNPLHSRKFAAAMQAGTGSGRPIYLRTSADAGHGRGSSLAVAVALEADTEAFLFDQLGMTWPPPR